MAAVFRRYVEHRNRYVRKAAHARCHRRLGYALACSGEEEKIRDSRVYAAYTDGLPVAISRHIRALTEELHFAGNIELLRHLLPEEEERDELLVQTLVVRYLNQPTLRELLVESVFDFAYANNMPCLFKTAFAAAHFYRYGKIPATLAGGSGDDSREERELESGLEERYSTPENLLLVAQRRLAGIREMADVKMIVDRALLSGDAATLAQVSLPLLKSTENVCRLVSPFVLGP